MTYVVHPDNANRLRMCAYRGKTFNQIHRQILYCVQGGDRHDNVCGYDIDNYFCDSDMLDDVYCLPLRHGNYVWGRDSHDNVCGYDICNYIWVVMGTIVLVVTSTTTCGVVEGTIVLAVSRIFDRNYVNYVIKRFAFQVYYLFCSNFILCYLQ